MRELSSDECKSYLEQAVEKPLLLDVREPWEYRIVHLEDSRLVPMREIPESAGELDQEQEIIVICHHGIRSRHVALYLENQGVQQGHQPAWRYRCLGTQHRPANANLLET